MAHTLVVQKRHRLETLAAYGSTTAESVSQRIQFPRAIRDDVGGVSVVLAPSVIADLEGAFRYLRDYPYICWEQVLTQGVTSTGLVARICPDPCWSGPPLTRHPTGG